MPFVKSLFDADVDLTPGLPLRIAGSTDANGPSQGYFRYARDEAAVRARMATTFRDDQGRVFAHMEPRYRTVEGLDRLEGTSRDAIPVLQSAIDDAAADATPDSPVVISIPEGTFFLDMTNRNDGIYLRHSNVWLTGAGMKSTIFKIPEGCKRQRIFFVGDPNYDAAQNRVVPQNIRIQDFTLDLNNTTAFVSGIAFRRPIDGVVVERIRGVQSPIAAGVPSNHDKDSWLCNFECYEQDINRNIVLVDVESYDQMQLHAGGGRGIKNFYNIRPRCFAGRANGMTITNVGLEGRFENINFIEPHTEHHSTRAIWIGPDDAPKRVHDLSNISQPCYMRGLKILRPTIGPAEGSYKYASGIMLRPFPGGISDVEIVAPDIDAPNADLALTTASFDYHWQEQVHGGNLPQFLPSDIDLSDGTVALGRHGLFTGAAVILRPATQGGRLPKPLVPGKPYFVRVVDSGRLRFYADMDGDLTLLNPIALTDRGEGAGLVALRPQISNLECRGLRHNVPGGVRLQSLRDSRFDDCDFARLDLAEVHGLMITNSRAESINIADDIDVVFHNQTIRTTAAASYRDALVRIQPTRPTRIDVRFAQCLFEVAPLTPTTPVPRYAVSCSGGEATTVRITCCRTEGFSNNPWNFAGNASVTLLKCESSPRR